MTPTDPPGAPDDDDALAAEYVIGVLDARDRAAASARIDDDRAFADRVAAWQERLVPLAETVAPVTPPGHVFAAIERRLFAGPEPAPPRGWWHAVALWRGIAFAALAVVIVLGALLAEPQFAPAPSDSRLVADLRADDSPVHMIALYDRRDATLAVRHLAGAAGQGRSFELWAIEGTDPPRSLGLVPSGGRLVIVLDRAMPPGIALAVSDEPAGGSPTGQPTGPIVAAGHATAF